MGRSLVTPAIVEVARHLGVPLHGDVHSAIVTRCVDLVTDWVTNLGPVAGLPALLELVAAKLCVHFEVIRSDEDVAEIARTYLKQREFAFATIDSDFRRATDAIVIRLEHAPPHSNKVYVAVIDGRGQKSARVWFSKWHEIAHLLAEPPQRGLVFRRTETTKRDPLERLMDDIGGALAFYGPLFRPLIARRFADEQCEPPTLHRLLQVHEEHCGFASAHATLNAIVKHLSTPLVLVEARMAVKASEEIASASVDMFPHDVTSREQLRAVTVLRNDAATKRGLYIPRNMRVPSASVIASVHANTSRSEPANSTENLAWWTSSNRSLPAQQVVVEAKRFNNRVLALIRPASLG